MPRSDSRHQRLHNRDRHLKHLRKVLARTPKIDTLEAFWVLDRARLDPSFRKPQGYNYPDEYLFARAGEPGSIHPWEIETLTTELLASKENTGHRVLNMRSWGAISKIVNALRDAENAEGLTNADPFHRNMFRTLHRQLPWQVHTGWNAADAVRWWSMFHNSDLCTVFESRVGLSLNSFIRIGMAWSMIFNARPFSSPTGTAEIGVSEADYNAFIEATCMSLDQARAKSRDIVSRSREIAYRQSPLRERPIISLATATNRRFIRPLEQTLVWRVTNGLYLDVIGDPRAPTMIGIEFEKYTLRLLRKAIQELTIDGEVEYGSRQRQQRSTVCIVHDRGTVQMLVECKAKKISLTAQTSIESTRDRETAVSELAKGVVQLCRCEQAIVKGLIPGYHSGNNIILLLVTLDDWIFIGPHWVVRCEC